MVTVNCPNITKTMNKMTKPPKLTLLPKIFKAKSSINIPRISMTPQPV